MFWAVPCFGFVFRPLLPMCQLVLAHDSTCAQMEMDVLRPDPPVRILSDFATSKCKAILFQMTSALAEGIDAFLLNR